MLRVILAGLVLALCGCASNPRFETATPSSKITGEAACEVPQHWKALALEGVNMQTLSEASVVQMRVPAEWIGDALGWFVETNDGKYLKHYPRWVWRAVSVDGSEKQFFPAIMKNPLLSPYLTILVTDPKARAKQTLSLYVLSGAATRLLTVSGERLRMPNGLGCMEMLDSDFARQFPSHAMLGTASTGLLTKIRTDFSKPALLGGVKYSINPEALSPQLVGDLRQVTAEERSMERGASFAVFPPQAIVPSAAFALARHVLNPEMYTGPFGERMYSGSEPQAALAVWVAEYNDAKHRLERRLGLPQSPNLVLSLSYTGAKSGWEIGEMLAPQVEAAWRVMERLEERDQARRNR